MGFASSDIEALELSEIYLIRWMEQSTAIDLTNKELPLIEIYNWWEVFLDNLQNNSDKLVGFLPNVQYWHVDEMKSVLDENRIKSLSGEASFYDLIHSTNISKKEWDLLEPQDKAIQLALVKYERVKEFINNMWKIYDIGMKFPQPKPSGK